MGLVEAVDHGRRRRVAAARVALALAAGLVALSLVSDSAPAGSGLVAAYAFNEGAGAVAADASGNDHPGAIQGAAWTTGHTGTALSLDGTTSNVAIGSLGTFYKSGFTLEAWVRKETTKTDVGIVGSWTRSGNGGPMLWVNWSTGRYELTLGTSSTYLDSGQRPVVGQWQFVVGTYDGTMARIYVDGTLAASSTFTGNVGNSDTWRIGAYDDSPASLFDGTIDDVRIYNRALNASEVAGDMNQPVAPDTTPPSAPGTLTADGGIGAATLDWGPASDDTAVTQYSVYRSTTSGFTPSASNLIAHVAGPATAYEDAPAAGTYYYKVTATDHAGNVGPSSNEAPATVTPDAAPTVDVTSPSGGSTLSGTVTVTASATDDVHVAGVQFKLDGQNLGHEVTASPYAVTWDTRAELNGGHTFTAVARDVNGQTTTSAPVAVTFANAGVSGTPPLAAYAFDDGGGIVAHDTSPNKNHATLGGGAAWSTLGRYGDALSLDGLSGDADMPALGTFYKNAFTLEAWVRKETTKTDVGIVGSWTRAGNGGPMLWIDYSTGRYDLTLGSSSTYLDAGQKPPLGQWQFVAATYDGTNARIYVDGALAASSVFTGNVGNSDTWRVGAYGDTPGGFFDGSIDNVRVYDRALTGAELQTDMATRIAPPDTAAPSAPGSLTADGSVTRAHLSWNASTDNVGVTHYNVYRSTSPGFTPSAANRIVQLAGTTTSYTDDGMAAGTYYYRVTAEDLAQNIGQPSNEDSATVLPDTTAPMVTVTAPGPGTLTGSTTLSANASDDIGVAGLQFKLDGQNLGNELTAPPYSSGWDTRGEINGNHVLTAVARDGAGNTTVSASIAITISNAGVSAAGLRADYGFDDGSGGVAADSSGNNNTATLAGTANWSGTGRFGGALSLDGSNGRADLPALGTFYKTGFTLEAWVRKQSTKGDAAVVGSWSGSAGGPMIWIDHVTGHYRLTLSNSFDTYLDSGLKPTVGQWQFVAGTYDGTTARIYVDGTLVASKPFGGNVGDANGWRVGAYGPGPAGFLDGLIDNVRIYNRSLSGAEIQTDMATRVQPDRTPPQVLSSSPADGASGLTISTSVTAKFNEPMEAGSLTPATFELLDDAGNAVPATVSYDLATSTATLAPQVALGFGKTYRAKLVAEGARDLAGISLGAEVSWSFTTEASPPPILLLTSSSNPFSSYLAEILRTEGLDEFTTLNVAFATPSLLSSYDVVVLGNVSLTAGQVATLSSWVNGGGNLVAMRPDKQLAGLLGLSDAGATLSNAYLKVDTASAPGAGIVGQTIQFHGSADLYTLNGASSIATLYSSASAATGNPAVTLRSVGSSGGQAAAFSYDLARSVVLTRQGNPAWAGQERDGSLGVRPDDMFYGAKPGDVQPDWIDTSKIAIPQADEQQRLLVNLITLMEQDKLPLPHFWYLPRGLKAAVVMSGDDHAQGGTASNFDRFVQLSHPGCVVADWQCVRGTSWIYPDSPLTNAQAAAYVAQGFEVAPHPSWGGCNATPHSPAEFSDLFDSQLLAFTSKYTSAGSPVSSRTHCVEWPDWASEAKIELAHGIRMDGNYYHYPFGWIDDKPGFLNGGGFPMRFADSDGSLIDVYQENTNMDDEAGQLYPATADALLDNAVGPNGYYGAFGTNIHTDFQAPQHDDEAIVAAAQARGVPVISYRQLLTWTDGRNNSTIRALSWSPTSHSLSFSTTAAAGANGLQTMLPTHGPSGTLTSLSCGGFPMLYGVLTIKGVEYATFPTITGSCTATYS